MLRANLYVSDSEVEQAYREQVERAKIRYVQLPRSRYLQGVEIPESELNAYFESHKNEYKLPEQREASYFLVEQRPSSPSNSSSPTRRSRTTTTPTRTSSPPREQVRARTSSSWSTTSGRTSRPASGSGSQQQARRGR